MIAKTVAHARFRGLVQGIPVSRMLRSGQRQGKPGDPTYSVHRSAAVYDVARGLDPLAPERAGRDLRGSIGGQRFMRSASLGGGVHDCGTGHF